MSNSKSYQDSEKICLIGKTTIANITFPDGKGIVFKQETAKIIGMVSGDKVKDFLSNKCLN